jgi:hypothetical protein
VFRGSTDKSIVLSAELEKKLNVSIDNLLKSQGFGSSDALGARVSEVANGTARKDWDTLRHTIDVTNTIERAIHTISGLASIAGAGSIGALVLVGAISGPAGWAAIGGIGTATAVVAVLTVVSSVVVGKVLHEKLKDTVEDLFHARADVFLQVRRMTLICDWMRILSKPAIP